MNKTYLIVGGASVASLAVGAAGGYFLAKKKFDNEIDGLITEEVKKTEKYFSVLLMEHKEGKPDSPEEVVDQKVVYDDTDSSAPDEDDESSDEQILLQEQGKKALIDYQGFAKNGGLEPDKPALDTIVQKNIFADSTKPKKSLPPRDDNGKFLPKQSKSKEQTPYIITAVEFLSNEPEHMQENLKYFVKEQTLLDTGDEVIDNGRVGEVNLTLFPTDAPDGERIICVRNEGLEQDYEIKLVEESLTDYMGLGESDSDLEEYDDEDSEPSEQAYSENRY